MGGVTAVAVWPTRPAPAELLDVRLEEGWTAVASGLKKGDRVLGYAACMFDDPEYRARSVGSHQREKPTS